MAEAKLGRFPSPPQLKQVGRSCPLSINFNCSRYRRIHPMRALVRFWLYRSFSRQPSQTEPRLIFTDFDRWHRSQTFRSPLLSITVTPYPLRPSRLRSSQVLLLRSTGPQDRPPPVRPSLARSPPVRPACLPAT